MATDSALAGGLALIGRGRMGTALGHALRNSSVRVVGPLGRGEPPGDCAVILLCVPDSAVAGVARTLPSGRVVGHCSGLMDLTPLAPHDAFSLHPLLSVTRETTSFGGAACATSSASDKARAVASALVRELGMRDVAVPDELRALYHAAASVGGNYVATVAAVAEQLMARAGLDRAALAPLVVAAVDNWRRHGVAGLTGPVVRGDEATIATQRRAIAEHAPALLPLWENLLQATRDLTAGDSRRRGGAP